MKLHKFRSTFFTGVSMLSLVAVTPAIAQTSSSGAPVAAANGAVQLGEIVVTAQKREESINTVPMSIQAASGAQLQRLGIQNASDLQKIVPGFNAEPSQYGPPVYTIRGIGFQDSSLAAGPTVSVYVDEVPLPFPAETAGTALDLQRVEVLKGPQGTLFGQNSTGGLVNFIANKPTDSFKAGADVTYGRFNTATVDGFISGPVAPNLDLRVSAGTTQGGSWQKSYTHDASLGSRDFTQGRAELLWKPTDSFKALLTFSAFRDRSETLAGQFYVVHPRGAAPLPAGYIDYPPAPHNDQAADWNSCVRRTFSMTSDCVGYHKNNSFWMGSLRLDYELGNDLVLTSLTAHERYDAYEPQDNDGTTYENLHTMHMGNLETTFQELRLAGKFSGRGNWIVGVNYESDDTFDSYMEAFSQGTSNPIFGYLTLNDTTPTGQEQIKTYAGYANATYPLTDTLSLEGGVRYTESDRKFEGCARDAGDGQWAAVGQAVSNFVLTGSPLSGPTPNPGPGSCGSIDGAPTFAPALFVDTLNESNVSWRAGVHWNPAPHTLVYANISKGYKAGSFPVLGASANAQFAPVKQESLLAYETGAKSTLLDGTLQLDGAFFYYKYNNKQILGDVLSEVFGGLNALVNIPQSHVVGFELSGVWRPLPGLTITPAVSNQNSKIDGRFVNFNAFGESGDFTGEAFPYSPKWQADLDAQYQWRVGDDYTAYIGGNVNFQSATNASLGQPAEFSIPAHGLLDLRAGVEKGPWQVQFWGRNVTNRYYVTAAYWAADAVVRYAGMPATYGVTVNWRY